MISRPKSSWLVKCALFVVAALLLVSEDNASQFNAGMIWVAGGDFAMGSVDLMARSNEGPVHTVRLSGFWIDRTPVTNEQFRKFVKATGYVTTAERAPAWSSIEAQLPPQSAKPPEEVLVPGAVVFLGARKPVDLDDYMQWWAYVPGADWQHPSGPDSSIDGKQNHPVVQVSYDDALAYAKWVHKSLPTEAEWEFAARGGLRSAMYSWGNEFSPYGRKMANVWDNAGGAFPLVDQDAGDHRGTSEVCSYPVNGYNLCDMAGNVWQWVQDWYRPDAYAPYQGLLTVNPRGPISSYDSSNISMETSPQRVVRGGSFLCSQNYCMSYRPSARRGSDPDSAMSHVGFRLIRRAGNVY